MNLDCPGLQALNSYVSLEIFKLNKPWSEGTSDAILTYPVSNENFGAAATPGDPTWTYNNYPNSSWGHPGMLDSAFLFISSKSSN